jgi:hypothetical protein
MVNSVGTKEQHEQGRCQMAKELKSVIERSRDTIVPDALGAAALVVLLMGGLVLPGLL